ncbi:MAG: hypothetical protein H7Y37_17380 [Anaerolineae bacterium]|nr:hypothetical protein [Gloeobacterales cyanobacterium ES-bin-313]
MENDKYYPVKAKLINMDNLGEDFTFQFNPTQIKISREVMWGPSVDPRKQGSSGNGDAPQSPGGSAPVSPDTGVDLPSYSKTKPYIVSINRVLFDTFEARTSVDKYITALKKTVTPSVPTGAANENSSRGKKMRPPTYLFTFGSSFDFICAVQRLSWNYSVWLPDGTPLRALVDLVLTETTLSKSVNQGGGLQNAIRTGSSFSIGASSTVSADLGVSLGVSAGFSFSAGMSGFI